MAAMHMALKKVSRRSYRAAMHCQSLSLQNMRSIRSRRLQRLTLKAIGFLRWERLHTIKPLSA